MQSPAWQPISRLSPAQKAEFRSRLESTGLMQRFGIDAAVPAKGSRFSQFLFAAKTILPNFAKSSNLAA